jgi:N-acyl-D-amino-acid deacylase
MTENLRRRGGANSLLLTAGDSSIRGKRLDAIAAARHTTPIEAAIQIILAGDASVASFNMNEKDIEKFMVQDFITTDSDGSDGHPRKYGTFPKLIREYVLTKHVLTMPQAIKRSSSTSAKLLGIPERGSLTPGYFADVIVFDPQTIADKATYEQPTLLAVGMKYVFVNGVLTIDDGRYTGVTAGKALKPK